MFFFEKKNQKTFASLCRDSPASPRQRNKSFLLLFFKKEGLSYPDEGFTLIELLMVITILSLLSALVAPRLFDVLQSAKTKLTSQQIAAIGSALDLFKLDTGRYPNTDEGLQALVTRPAGVANWNGPYTNNNGVPQDPWKHDWLYRSPSTRQGRPYDLCSSGGEAAGVICN